MPRSSTLMSSNEVVPGVGPAFAGYVDTTVNAFRIVRAAIDGVIPRTSRRLSRVERVMLVRSGTVFVFSVLESGIKRWTDGMSWSPSRIQGNFLIYKELELKASGRDSPQKSPLDDGEPIEIYQLGSDFTQTAPAELRFKANGLIKKTITITVRDSDFHLVCYYKRGDVSDGVLNTPNTRADMMSLHLSPEDFHLDNLRSPVRVERGPDGRKCIVDEIENTTGVGFDKPESEGPVYKDPQYSMGNQRRPPHTAQHYRSDTDQLDTGYSPPRRFTTDSDARIVSPPGPITADLHGQHNSPLPHFFDEQHHHRMTSPSQLSSSPPMGSSDNSHSTTWSNPYQAHQAHRNMESWPERYQLQNERQSSPERRGVVRQDWISGVGPRGLERTIEPAASMGETSENRNTRCSSSLLSSATTMNDGVRPPGRDVIRRLEPSYGSGTMASSLLRASTGEWSEQSPRTWTSYASSYRNSRDTLETQRERASSSMHDNHFSGWSTPQSSTNPTPSSSNTPAMRGSGSNQIVTAYPSTTRFAHYPPIDASQGLPMHDHPPYHGERGSQSELQSQEGWYDDQARQRGWNNEGGEERFASGR